MCKLGAYCETWKMESSDLFEGLIFCLARSVHFVRRQFGQLLWDSLEIAQNRRRTTCTEHASKKIRPSKRLELYIFQIKGEAQKSPLSSRFSGFFLISEGRPFSRNSTRKPSKFNKITDFYTYPS